MPNLYEIFNIEPSASPDQIKAAYRKLVMKVHPDKNEDSNAQEQFICVQDAYDTLSDPFKKQKYDEQIKSGNFLNKDNDGDSFEKIFHSNLDEIINKIPEILVNYTQKLKIKDKELDTLYYEWQFLNFISNVIFAKTLENILSENYQPSPKTNTKLTDSLRQLQKKFEDKFLLKTRKEMLILQDYIQDGLHAGIKQNKSELFKDSLQMWSYSTPLNITLFFWDSSTKESTKQKRESITNLIKTCPLKQYLEIREPESTSSPVSIDDDDMVDYDGIGIGTMHIHVKVDYFTRNKSLLLGDDEELNTALQPGANDKIATYKQNLLAYIEKRSGKRNILVGGLDIAEKKR